MTAAVGTRGQIGVSPADREQAIEALKAAFVQGRLDRDEFEARIGHALAASTYADLATVTAVLPAGLTAGRPPRRAAHVQPRRPVNRGVKWGAYGLVTPGILAAAAAVAVLSGSDAVGGVAGLTAVTIGFLYLVLWLFVGADLFVQWRKERSRRQSPPRPALSAGGRPSQGLAVHPAGQLAPVDDDRRHGAEAAQSRLPHPYLIGSLAPRHWRAGGCRHAVGQAVQ